MARRDPQQKKALSYARDRRNDWGENDKSSRRNIRRDKRAPNRADRHRERQVLAGAAGAVIPPEVAERAEIKLYAKRTMWLTKKWRKWRDAPLAEVVEAKLRRRARTGMQDPADVEARIERLRRHLR